MPPCPLMAHPSLCQRRSTKSTASPVHSTCFQSSSLLFCTVSDSTPVALWVINKSCRKWELDLGRGGAMGWEKRSMCLLIISAAKAHHWVRCQPPQALDLLPRLYQPYITTYIQVYSSQARNGLFRARNH